MRRALALAPLLLVAVAATARADRTQQAQQLWQHQCANCHVVGQGQALKTMPHGFTDLTLATRTRDDGWLRAWILAPHAIKPDTRCYTAGLDARQIDLLIAFLRGHAKTVHKHAVASAQSKPPRPPDPPPEPPRGLVRGR